MSKLKLNLDELKVESFETGSTKELNGTVAAQASGENCGTIIDTCPETCDGNDTCIATCEGVYLCYTQYCDTDILIGCGVLTNLCA